MKDKDYETKKIFAEIKKASNEYAKKTGIKLNPDLKQRNWVFYGLTETKKKFGEFYCPCRVLSEDKEENKKKICPCFWHKEEIKKWGHCLCKLFFKK